MHSNLQVCTRPIDAREHGHSALRSQTPRAKTQSPPRRCAIPCQRPLPGHGVKGLRNQPTESGHVFPSVPRAGRCVFIYGEHTSLNPNKASGVKRSQIHDIVLIVNPRCRPSRGAGISRQGFLRRSLGTICQVLQFLCRLSPCCSCKRRQHRSRGQSQIFEFWRRLAQTRLYCRHRLSHLLLCQSRSRCDPRPPC